MAYNKVVNEQFQISIIVNISKRMSIISVLRNHWLLLSISSKSLTGPMTGSLHRGHLSSWKKRIHLGWVFVVKGTGKYKAHKIPFELPIPFFKIIVSHTGYNYRCNLRLCCHFYVFWFDIIDKVWSSSAKIIHCKRLVCCLKILIIYFFTRQFTIWTNTLSFVCQEYQYSILVYRWDCGK